MFSGFAIFLKRIVFNIHFGLLQALQELNKLIFFFFFLMWSNRGLANYKV